MNIKEQGLFRVWKWLTKGIRRRKKEQEERHAQTIQAMQGSWEADREYDSQEEQRKEQGWKDINDRLDKIEARLNEMNNVSCP